MTVGTCLISDYKITLSFSEIRLFASEPFIDMAPSYLIVLQTDPLK